MNDRNYIYGDNHGSTYDGETSDHHKTFWDSRLEIQGFAHTVQVGIVPPSDKSTDDGGIWDHNDGQFITLSRDGINRTIVALRDARDAIYGKDQ